MVFTFKGRKRTHWLLPLLLLMVVQDCMYDVVWRREEHTYIIPKVICIRTGRAMAKKRSYFLTKYDRESRQLPLSP